MMHAMQTPSQTPLVDQVSVVHNAALPPTPDERDGLGIFQAPHDIGESSGYAGRLPADRTPQDYGHPAQGEEESGLGQDNQWYTPVVGSHEHQLPRRRSQFENSRRN